MCTESVHRTWTEKIVNVNVEAFHSNDAVLLELTNTLDEDPTNESLGLRSFALYIARCATNC